MEQTGTDSAGEVVYGSAKEMWRMEAGEDDKGHTVDEAKKKEWYGKGIDYWQSVDATVDGVLGGYGNVSAKDVAESGTFLKEVFGGRLADGAVGRRHLVALDCGAGVGRVTQHFLLQHFHEVDLMEPVENFLNAARNNLAAFRGEPGQAPDIRRHCAVNFFCQSMEHFSPQPNRYDVIWIQWCSGHLTDTDFVEFFKRCQTGLKSDGGLLILKENNAKSGFVVDKEDSSVTRSNDYICELIGQAGLQILKVKLQKGFPKELFAVRMYAVGQFVGCTVELGGGSNGKVAASAFALCILTAGFLVCYSPPYRMAKAKRKQKSIPQNTPSFTGSSSPHSSQPTSDLLKSPSSSTAEGPSFSYTLSGWMDGVPTTVTLSSLDRWAAQAATRVTLDFNGKQKILISQDPHSPHLGGYIWDSAALLCLYLQAYAELGRLPLHDLLILELGAGVVALPSILCAKLGARRVIATDIPELVDGILENIQMNRLSEDVITARPLVWGDTEAMNAIVKDLRPNVILASDCIYSEASAKALVQTMDQVCTSMVCEQGISPAIYCISEVRNAAAQLEFQQEASKRFDLEIVPGPDDVRGGGKEGWWRWVPPQCQVDHVNFYTMSLKM
ncbi:hypothetical protein CBR_g19259 [Chara braunii]|uniref:Alpha N-terminal protein methyltransferase 1 n=1 Tax=Chara braunii TaxID=69332 RepID=A0A388JTV5_CHABU|nr:hypothetical protein CBR_g19259 [Chara braunii]|eukprot:GBG61183.1 hypothetical protein CBR_g19259 [Chara braunii]